VTLPGASPSPVRPGEILAGKYRVERVLGVGGMGLVLAAHHLELNEMVALKLLLPEGVGNPDATARFLQEARAAVRIKNEHVAAVRDVGTLPNGTPYMVMEYLEGVDLAGWLKQRGSLPVEQAVEFLLQACVAVADAHALGIVHRDLKPANLFCVRRSDGRLSIKVLDFGISKMTDPRSARAGVVSTRTATLMGSPLYMSPEQLRSSKDVDARTDIWALGVILFEFVTGQRAFNGESITELAIKIATEPTPAIRDHRSDAASELQSVIDRCLEKDRAARYPNIGALSLALLPFAPSHAKAFVERVLGIVQAAGLSPSGPPMPGSPLADANQQSAGTLPPVGRTAPGLPKSKALTRSAGVAAIVVSSAVYALLLRYRGAASPTGAPLPPPTLVSASGAPSSVPAIGSMASAVAEPPKPVESAGIPEPPPSSSASPSPALALSARPANAPNHRLASVSASVVPTVAPAPRATVSCDPPYFINERGAHVFKKECL
jgi:serine/threonine protein kinase